MCLNEMGVLTNNPGRSKLVGAASFGGWEFIFPHSGWRVEERAAWKVLRSEMVPKELSVKLSICLIRDQSEISKSILGPEWLSRSGQSAVSQSKETKHSPYYSRPCFFSKHSPTSMSTTQAQCSGRKLSDRILGSVASTAPDLSQMPSNWGESADPNCRRLRGLNYWNAQRQEKTTILQKCATPRPFNPITRLRTGQKSRTTPQSLCDTHIWTCFMLAR